jgi:O-antigen/teichoic acid export membrane protein
MRIFNVHAAVNASEIRNTIAVACSLILLTPLCTIGGKILSGYQQTHTANLVTAVAALFSVGGLLLGLHLRLSMPMLFLCTTGFITFSGVSTLIWVLFIAKPWLRPRMDYLSVSLSRQLLIAGAPFFLIRIAGIVVFSTDNLIISHFLGAAHVTPYSVGMRLVTSAQLIPSFLFPSLWASYAESAALGDIAWIRRTYTRAMRYSMVIIGAILVVIALFGQWIIAIWAGQVAVPSEPLLLGMCVWTILWGITSVQSCLLGALGRTWTQAVFGVIAAVLNLVLSIMLVQRIGALGVIAGTVISYICIVIPQTREVSAYFREQRILSTGDL